MNHIHNPADAASAKPGAAPLDQLFALTVALGEAMEHDLTRRGLTRARATLIWHLHAHGPMKQRELAAALRVSPRNVTALLDALAPSGLVARAAHPTDGRASLVTLTEQGRVVASMLAAHQQELARFLFADVAAAELTGFTRTMAHVLRRLSGPEFNQLREAALARWISRHGSAE